VTIGGVVDRLVAKGLLAREVSPRDRRARVLELSPAGQEVLRQAYPVAEAVQGDILEGLSAAERDSFTALLRKVTEAGNDHSRAPLVPLAKPEAVT
jgi:DNA-binding MarR family transcriptional regulator